MTKIEFDIADLQHLMGYDISAEKIEQTLPHIGSDLEGIDEDGTVSVEFFPSRPDMYSVEGVARALSAFIGIREGLREYYVGGGDVKVIIDPSIIPVRPVMLSAVIRGIDVDEGLIKSMMNLQEKLHLTVGRKRAKVSIGLHDLDTVKGPFTYKAVYPKEVVFEPLGMDGEYMDLSEILRRHEKGKAYAFILEGMDQYPLFVDSNGTVLSFPPIINGVTTTINENTRNVLMDVTGTDINAVEICLNIILCALADRGGSLESVRIDIPEEGLEHYQGRNLKPKKMDGHWALETPNMEPRTITLHPDYVRAYLGFNIGDDTMIDALRHMGMEGEIKNGVLEVKYPPYRGDILHPVDIVEDVAIGVGYQNIAPQLPRVMAFGRTHPIEALKRKYREAMIGAGYTEIKTLSLTNMDHAFGDMNVSEDSIDFTVLRNPLTAVHTMVRPYILPSLMEILKLNKKRDMPQRIFEVGEVVVGGRNLIHAGAVCIHPKASFTGIKSLFESVMGVMGLESWTLSTTGPYSGAFIPGRYADILMKGVSVGFFGELHPSVLERWELGAQVTAIELDLSALYGVDMEPV